MADFKPIRSLQNKVPSLDVEDGQFILTETGNIYVDMPGNQRIFIRGASIPIVLTEAEYLGLIESGSDGLEIDGSRLFYDPNGIYMIIRDSAKKETE